MKSLKRLIARRGRPEKIYSDNFSTFKCAKKWLKDERLNDYLASQKIQWQLNLSRAPWWGGQFERMVGLVKQALYKVVGNSLLNWSEFEETCLDLETTVNNRPLAYIEDDEQLPILTPNVMLFGIPNYIPENDRNEEDVDLVKRARHLRKTKEKLWLRWSREYVKSLRERHNLNCKSQSSVPKVNEVVLIRGDQPNRGKWKIGIVESLIVGTDGVTRAATLRCGKSTLQRAVQQLYPLELSCDAKKKETELSVDAKEFRPKRNAAVVAKIQITEQLSRELEESD